MTEFQEVMRQWARMCNSVPGKNEYTNLCSDKESGYICPMKDCGLCNKPLSSQTNDDRLIGERIIMAWAAENPEPIYPTWEMYLVDRMSEDMRDGKTHNPQSVEEYMCKTRIPANIAEKLGIEPKKE